MDINPLDILAAAALGGKDASPKDENSTELNCQGPKSDSSSLDNQDDDESDDVTKSDMGKSGKYCIKSSPSKAATSGAVIMAPQKTPWSPDALLQFSLGDQTLKSDSFCLDDIVKDIKTKDLDMELKKIIGKSFAGDENINHNFINDSHSISLEMSHESKSASVTALANNEDNATKEPHQSSTSTSESDVKQETIVDEEKQDTSSMPIDSIKSSDETNIDTDSSETKKTNVNVINLDHPYAMVEGQTRSIIPFDSDDTDFGSDLSPSMEDSEQRSRNLSLDCSYLKSGIMEGVSASALDLYGIPYSGVGRSKLPSTSSSASSPSADTGIKCKGSPENFDHVGQSSESSFTPLNPLSSPSKPSLKYGKFKIGTFASFSSSNLELEKYLRNQDHPSHSHRNLKIGIPSETHGIGSTLNSPSVQPLLQSPSLDWDRSEAGSETHDDSSDSRTPHRLSPDFTTEQVTEWSHPMYHDHDYCAKAGDSLKPDLSKKNTTLKRKYTKRKNMVNHDKIMKAKYLKKELLKQDNFLKYPAEPEPIVDESSAKSNPVGRPRKKLPEKEVTEEIDPETGSKLKITGRFQDQYVYYLSKSSRSTTRRRQAPSLPLYPDKIIVPPPKPGDIVVHHLTDSDIETVRLKGRSALNLPERPAHTNSLPTSTLSSSLSTCSSCPNQSNDIISDVDIVSTILSMENDNLSSPTSSHAPHNIHGLHSNQTVLNGDNSMTSEHEHVLNYLLSSVKDEHFLGGGNSFEPNTSALFPSIPPDAIYSKADSSDFVSNFSTSSVVTGPDHFASDSNRGRIEDNVGLPQDFSSFMSSSQESASNCNQHDKYSDSLKSMLSTDLSSLGTQQMTSSTLTSIEKTLDYLGMKDGELNGTHSGNDSPQLNGVGASTSPLDQQTDETPWIVTVTLYFNDVPAIMVNSQPYIRLVDIHKQILPAKDTGILKKRCQLLNIPVLNCNEMQRYFLVQYGRAYNSKSTLIVSKDQATKLVTYYATPQPRIGKIDDNHSRPGSNSLDTMLRSPLPGVLKQKGLSKSAKQTVGVFEGSTLINGDTQLCGRVIPVLQKGAEDSHGKRTRHKKVNYLEMLKGEEKVQSPEDAIMATIEAVARAGPDHPLADKKQKLEKKKKKKSKKLLKDSTLILKKADGSKKKKNSKHKRHSKKSANHLSSSKRKSIKSLALDGLHSLHTPESNLDVSNDDSQSKKCKPLKLKVNSLFKISGQKKQLSSSPSSASPSTAKKGGLFSRSNSIGQSSLTSSTTSLNSDAHLRPQRILPVAHQAATASISAEAKLPSQPGDIHLDLFIRPSAACVQCRTCSQFLSVPHFMRHHHVPMESESLASEATHRILVPLATSNINGQSQQGVVDWEHKLWEEFHRLQEAIGGFTEGDDESDSDVNFDEEEDIEKGRTNGGVVGHREQQSMDYLLNKSPVPSDILSHGSSVPQGVSVISATNGGFSACVNGVLNSPSFSPVGLKSGNDTDRSSLCVASLVNSDASVRHSSRRRKSKQFFSIENYDTVPPRIAEG